MGSNGFGEYPPRGREDLARANHESVWKPAPCATRGRLVPRAVWGRVLFGKGPLPWASHCANATPLIGGGALPADRSGRW
jgi:hypothetical protein